MSLPGSKGRGTLDTLVAVQPAVQRDGHRVHASEQPLGERRDCATAGLSRRRSGGCPREAVHFRDEHGFAIFSLEQAGGARVRARGYLLPEITLRAVVRVVGTWTQHGWQVQVRTVELVDHLDRRGVAALLVAYTTHLVPVRAAAAVERFGDRLFEVIRERPEEQRISTRLARIARSTSRSGAP